MGTRYPVHGTQRSLPLSSQYPVGSREVADLARETSSSGLSTKEDSPPQGPPTAVSCSGSSSEGRISAAYDSFLMINVNPSFSYHALHSLLKNSVPEVRQIQPPRWFVAYYRNGRGNFIHASRYLAKEIGTIPEGNLKKYGKGVLMRANDITQARMLQHLPCPSDSVFEIVKAHPTFNYSKGCVYSQDLYVFPEEEILAMCPSSVQKVTKMRNSSNMVLLTFFWFHPS
ncbi:hypothetical protein E2C01_086493 [Portunus trituberculatus]|uniref:Uncharacterized protein n=1 Tax=Portunus trituberculatus TaxID=210409 RepID=A0A5B7J9U6_PORTR|nr:hypothetical protein [Portunus trituberculatus]